MRMLVLGAKLQGTEVIYLAKEAGYHVTVIDKDKDAPAVDLADRYIKADILRDSDIVKECYKKADVVFPVIEDEKVLKRAVEYGAQTDTKVIFDLEAYKISSSKLLSNKLFEELNLPLPGKYPDCQYPVILKPDGMSGSTNVKKAYSKEEVEAYFEEYGRENVVVQEYLDGPSYSLEVIGDGEKFYFPQITEVCVDASYDCNRIAAPAVISDDIHRQMMDIGQKLAKKLKIKGIFDIEVIDDNGTLKLLEIDARFPSQTPVSVYNSTGINMVKMLAELTLFGETNMKPFKKVKHCLYQQIAVRDGSVEMLGEHIIGDTSHLKRFKDFMGADEVMAECDIKESPANWKAIVIITRKTEQEAVKAFNKFVDNIRLGGIYDKISA